MKRGPPIGWYIRALCLATALVSFSRAETEVATETMLLECPILECLYDLEPGVCFQHDGAVPTQKIKGKSCPASQFCPFEYQNKYMWIDEALQGQKKSEGNRMLCK